MEKFLKRLKTSVNSFSCCKGLSSDDVSSFTEQSISAIDCSDDGCSPIPVWRCPQSSLGFDSPLVSPRSLVTPFTQLPPVPFLTGLGCASSFLPPVPELSESDNDSSASSSSSDGSLFTYTTPFNRSQSRVSIGDSPSFEDDHLSEAILADDLLNFRKITYLEKRKKRPLTHLIGSHNQMTVNGIYSGAQCTVTSLNAIVYHHFKNMAFWNKTTVDNIVRNGDYHHTLFRDVYQYSRNIDGRIALDELPSTVKFNYDEPTNPFSVSAYVGEGSGLVFLSQTGMTKDLMRPTLNWFLDTKSENLREASFLITVNEHSYSAAMNKRRQWYLFDSHGSLKVSKAIVGKTEKRPTKDCLTGATVTRFPNLSVLMRVLKKNHGAGSPCEARLVTVIPRLDLSFNDEQKQSKAKLAKESNSQSIKQSKPKTNCKPAPTYTVRACSQCDNRAQFITAPPISDGSVEDVPDEDVIHLN